jgi:hypothetical protein
MLRRVFEFLLGSFGFSAVVGSLWVFYFLFLDFLDFSIFASFRILLVCSVAPTSFIKFLSLLIKKIYIFPKTVDH